jgi:hypothetical protein
LARIAPSDQKVQSAIQSTLLDADEEVRARADEALRLVMTPAPVAA